MSRHFALINEGSAVDDALHRCLAADDCMQISYAGSEGAAASVSRVSADGRTVAMAPIGAIQDVLRGFSPATLVATANGARPASSLATGDRVIGPDGQTVTVVAIRNRQFGWRELGVNPFLRPIRIAEGALGHDLPVETLVVAPGQPVLDGAGDVATLVPAHALLGRPGVTRPSLRSVAYVELVLTDGAATPLPASCMPPGKAPKSSA